MSSLFYLPEYFQAEHELAAYICRMLKQGCDKITPVVEGLGYLQPKAVELACQSPISILCGPPGTGKTTTLRRIVDSFQAAGMVGALFAPTAKASKRGRDVINTDRKLPIECVTVHRGLEYSKKLNGFARNRYRPIELDYLILEEFSMTELLLAADLFRAIDPKKTRVILCGDQHQLPSVGPGNFARDLIHARLIPYVELDHIFRTGANSGIAHNAFRVLRGEELCKNDPTTNEPFQDFFFVPKQDPTHILDFIVENVVNKMPNKRGLNPMTDIQVLSPGKKGISGTESLNTALRMHLNPEAVDSKRFGMYRIGDKVINRKNNYQLEIVNGDVGIIYDITDTHVCIDFGGGVGQYMNGQVEIPKDQFEKIYLAYCSTIHSSQGSEYPAVVMAIHEENYKLLYRELLYTGMTRAKQIMVLVGSPRALTRAIDFHLSSQRNTNMQSILLELAKKAELSMLAA